MRSFATILRFPLTLLGLILVIVGCRGDSQVAVYPAHGQILVAGEPAAYATIMMIPEDQSGERELLRPHAKADDQGRFSLSTYGREDGAPVGKYKVTIAWHGPPPGFDAAELSEEERTSGPDRLEGKYDDPATTSLTATIQAGENQLPPFDLEPS